MNHVAKIIEVVGTSDKSVEDAIQGAISRASETIEELQWFQVTELRGAISDQKIDRYQVMLKIGFGLNDDKNS
ncbi:MAG: dodecin [Alteraurantiacibacter sp.]